MSKTMREPSTPRAIDFENEIWPLTRQISSDTAYSYAELKAMYDIMNTLTISSIVVEVGCEFGRSTSLLALMAKARGHKLVLIDPFVSNVAQLPMTQCMAMLKQIEYPFTLHCMPTLDVPVWSLPPRIDLLHIDGDHSETGVEIDCIRLLPRVRSGGYVLAHDYGRDSLPCVKPVLDKHTANAKNWTRLGVWGTMAAWRNIQK